MYCMVHLKMHDSGSENRVGSLTGVRRREIDLTPDAPFGVFSRRELWRRNTLHSRLAVCASWSAVYMRIRRYMAIGEFKNRSSMDNSP